MVFYVHVHLIKIKKKIITNISCSRFEIYGWQINHLVLYTGLGFFFPYDFWLWQGLGLLWEIIEFIPYVYPSVLQYIGGCVDTNIIDTSQTSSVDMYVGLYSPIQHFWHVKLTDIILNIVGFGLGILFFRIFIK